MQRIFLSSSELQHTAALFEKRLEILGGNHRNFILINTINGESISSLNDIVGIVGMPLGGDRGTSAILFYFTELDIPIEIKREIDDVFNELFYNA